ncbi:hypothetical protein [Chryseobacterium rhizosphaerae]|uniref:Glycoside hydrolase n=1 Tax=Chryseobacterium rhizosphaerae TaxID=395937 RepID=A0ABX9IQ52_9FLAO|nr:hypothetical protein [Chryseobacterium rhizosphaerae]REC77040.1 hypothetical protein DRF57_06550 [Chryseobacterium rhizosphaerae]GEN68574.1 hypothetical protein CRH01_31420 [Chryseobacterium rhizosphaerae]
MKGKEILAMIGICGLSLMNAQVGINTSTPDPSAILHLESPNKGFLPTRLTLTSATDGVTIPNPATGLVVYHKGSASMGAGIYVNIGTPSAPQWTKSAGGQDNNETNGSNVYKSKYRGRNAANSAGVYSKPNLLVPELNLMIRFAVVDNMATDPDIGTNARKGNNRLQVRLINKPDNNVTITSYSHWHGPVTHSSAGVNLSFTPASFDQWQNTDAAAWNNQWGYYYLLYSSEIRADKSPKNFAMNLYGICGYGNSIAAGPLKDGSDEMYSLAAEVF